MKILFFGAKGFIGRSLARQLSNFQVQIESSEILRQSDPAPVAQLIQAAKADWILQLSGAVQYGNSPFDLYKGNILPTVQLAEGLRLAKKENTPVYILGSAAELGRTTEVPVNENYPCQPHTDYGLSKFQQTQFAILKNTQGYRFSSLRLFNVIGPGMNKSQVPQCFVEQLRKGAEFIQTGLLDFPRDFLHVKDVGKTIGQLLNQKWNGGMLNLCSGVSHTPRELLNEILKQSHSSAIVLEEKNSLFGSFPSLADPSELIKVLGAAPLFSLEQTVSEILETR